MENGNIMKFLEINKPATGVRLSLILDVALGLQYLHQENVIHGDLKALNILVTPSGKACIADFGVSSITHAMTLLFTTSTANGRGGTARYQAPELFQGGRNHFGSDVYAFACVCYEVVQEAVKLQHKLAETDPSVTQDLANSLHNLGNDLRAIGHNKDAVQVEEEGVRLYRKLAKTDPSVTKNLAKSLHNLGYDLHAIGRNKDAVQVYEEAVRLCRKLAETDPFLTKDLAASLHNLGYGLHAIGRNKDAVQVYEEAVRLRRRLAETDPLLTKDLANSLHNLGVDLHDIGCNKDAVQVKEEAVRLYRKLAETDPSVTKDLADSLCNLGVDLHTIGRNKDVVQVYEEAVRLYCKLAMTYPSVTKDLANSLHNPGVDLHAIGRNKDAVQVYEEAVRLRHRLAETDPYIHTLPLELSDIPGYLDVLKHFSSIDDRKFLFENIVTLLSRLSVVDSPALNSLAKNLQSTLIDILYKDLPYLPSNYLSMLPQNAPTTAAPNAIKYAYRNADGSNYVPLFPGLGKANAPYARSVPAANFSPPATLPDAGLIFDTLMSREKFEEHPGGVSALFFAFAELIIHSVFNTSHADPTINATSSYLDLSILYGNSQKEQDSVRNKDGRGRLYEDVFADSRLLWMPPAVGALLYTAQKILEINEDGTYKNQFADEATKLAQDDEIFHRARLVNCCYFMQIILGDYVGAILGLGRDGYIWRLDPLSQSREPTHDLTARGEGNVVSVEFNLLYRWHATLSEKDTEWTENLFKELFNTEEFSSIEIKDFIAVAAQKMRPGPDPQKWTFNKRRGADGRFKDSDLAKILYDSTSWRAGAAKARGIPEVLRVIEVLGIEQARRWGVFSMNDFRRFLGLKPYANFQEWNPDERVHTAAAALYKDIENLELYVGLQAEEAKEPMAGAGLCPGYTISRSILADVVCLTHGNRFLTVEFAPSNLTAWGYRDCQFDTQDGSYGGMLTKLLFRTLPAYYPARSVYAHFPFLDPAYMLKYIIENSLELEVVNVNKYIWTRPTPSARAEVVVVVKTDTGVRAVLDKHTVFPTGYAERLEEVTKRRNVNHDFVNKILLQETDKWATYFAAETERLIEKRALDHIGKSGKVQYVDIVGDVINMLPVHWICQQLAGLQLKDGDLKDEQRQYESFSNVCRYVFLNSEPSHDWRLRESSVKTFHDFEQVVKENLRIRYLDAGRRSSLADSLPFLNKLHDSQPDLTELAAALFTEVVPTAAHWSQAIAHVVNHYLDDSRAQARQEIIELAQTTQGNGKIAAHIRAALALDPPVWGVYRTAHTQDIDIDSVKIPIGTRVFASIKEANMNDGTNVQGLIPGIEEHGLLSASFFESTAPQVLGKILGLKNLKRAPGKSGYFNRFVETTHGVPLQWYVNTRSEIVPWPDSLVVEYHV
ncbi:heme peroxidase [Mycena leptocephala]|nr:heme peroxidase [Mycena leptocephala]